MLPRDDVILNTLTPKIQLLYSDIQPLSETEYCQTFDAISRSDNQKYTIRTLNLTSDFYKKNPNLATTFFIQELLHLCTSFPDAVVIESFESHERGHFACAIKHCETLQQLFERDEVKGIDFELMIKNVQSDVEFLLSKLKLSQTISIESQSIYQFNGKSGYFLSDWVKSLGKDSIVETRAENADNTKGTREAYNLGMRVLELNGILREDIDDVKAIRNAKLHNGGIENMLAELNQPEKLKNTLRKLLCKPVDPNTKGSKIVQEVENKMAGVEERTEKGVKPDICFQGIEYVESIVFLGEEKKGMNGISSPLLKVSRFEKIHPTETWSYFHRFDDGIAMAVSKSILIEGIGLYVPLSQHDKITGKVRISKGSHKEGTILATKEVKVTANAHEVVDKIYQVMFEEPVLIEAQTKYTIHFNLGPVDVFGCSGYKGTGGKSLVKGAEDVLFTFITAFGEGLTSVYYGQVPEIYYRLKK